MESIEIKGTKRKNIGKSFVNTLRKEGNVPCNLYGGKENVLFQTSESAFRNLVYSPNVYSVKLDIEGDKYDAIIQDIQFHPVTDKIVHVDFYQVDQGKKVVIAIPVKISGDSEGVKQGGKLHIKKRRIHVKGFLKDLPDALHIDISNLALGKSIKVGDLSFDKIELLDPSNDVVCSVKLTRVSKSETEGEVAAETAEAATEAAPAAEDSTK